MKIMKEKIRDFDSKSPLYLKPIATEKKGEPLGRPGSGGLEREA